MIRHSAWRWAERALLAIGLVLLAIWFKNNREAAGFQAAASRRLGAALAENELVGPPAPGAARPRRTIALEQGVLGRIEIPRLGIHAVVAEGTDAALLRRAVGHISNTALPGRPGNVALAGHRDTYFRGLGEVRENDVIRFVTLHGTYRYRVEWGAVVTPHRVDVLDSTATPSLTLVTCYPFQAIGPAPERFVVRARQIEPAVALEH